MIPIRMRRRSSSSHANCCVSGCTSAHKKNPELSFHRFPKREQMVNYVDEYGNTLNLDRRELWEIRLKIGKPVLPYMQVCSKHFTNEDYITPDTSCYVKRYLKKNAIPSQNLPEKRYDATIDGRSKESKYQLYLLKRREELPCSTNTCEEREQSLIINDVQVKEEDEETDTNIYEEMDQSLINDVQIKEEQIIEEESKIFDTNTYQEWDQSLINDVQVKEEAAKILLDLQSTHAQPRKFSNRIILPKKYVSVGVQTKDIFYASTAGKKDFGVQVDTYSSLLISEYIKSEIKTETDFG